MTVTVDDLACVRKAAEIIDELPSGTAAIFFRLHRVNNGDVVNFSYRGNGLYGGHTLLQLPNGTIVDPNDRKQYPNLREYLFGPNSPLIPVSEGNVTYCVENITYSKELN